MGVLAAHSRSGRRVFVIQCEIGSANAPTFSIFCATRDVFSLINAS
jgi:hypothetical protein